MGIKESQFKPSIVERNAYPGIDPDELEQGKNDEEEEHHMSPDKAETTALQHLKGKNQGHYYSGMEKAKEQGMLKDMVSPTARPTPIIGVAIRGSVTGGLPSGADQTGISPNTPTGRLGGYEPIPIAKDNSELIDKTPKNSAICSSRPISEPTGNDGEKHAHQVQNDVGEPPQAVTGASEDSDDTLTLKSAVPKDIEVGGVEGNDMDGEEDEEGSDPESATELRESKKSENTDGFKPMGRFKPTGRYAEEMAESSDSESDDDIKESVLAVAAGTAAGTMAYRAAKDLWKNRKCKKCKKNKSECDCEKDKKEVNEGKHKSGCTCGFCANKGKMGKKKEGGPSAADNVKKSFKKKKEVDEGEEKNNDNNPEFKEKDEQQWRKDRSASAAGDNVRKSFEKDSKENMEETYKKHKKLMNEKLGLDNGPKYSNGNGGVPTTTLLELKQSLQEKAISGTMNKKESETFRLIQEVLTKRKL